MAWGSMYAQCVEPVTHMLTGACLSRALGFPRSARHATLACVIAAELPDADYVYRLGGPITYFQHHRGWTHAFWSLPLQAAFVVAMMYGWTHLRERLHNRKPPRARELSPLRPIALGVMALLALLSHILLDWTNNYGVRPFAPWNPHWYAGELVFIVEPVFLAVLALALLLPLIFSLTDAEIANQPSIRPGSYRGQWLAATALLIMAGCWGWRWVEHDAAVSVAEAQQYSGGRVLKVSADPAPVNPYKWHVVVETPNNFAGGSIDTRTGTIEFDQATYPKPETTLQTLAAKHSQLGRAYLDWSQFPQVQQIGTAGEIHPGMDLSPEERQLTVVRFLDLRFLYDEWGFHGRTSPPLTGEAWVNDNREVVRQSIDGAVQR